MEKRWVYTLMACVVIGTIFVIGSIAVNTAGANNDPTGFVAVNTNTADVTNAAGSVNTAAYLYTNVTSGNYKNWFACTFPADTSNLLIYKVPAGTRFQIDDVEMITGINSGYSYGFMFRGATGSNYIMEVSLNPHGTFGQQFKGLILNAGEQLKIRSYTSGDTSGICWAITGHKIT